MKLLLSLCAFAAIASAQTDSSTAVIDTAKKTADTIAATVPSDSTAAQPPVAVSAPEQPSIASTPDGTTTLSITVIPDSAHIFIDGTDRGTGKATADFLGTAPHEIRCALPGYEAENRRLILRAGSSRSETIVLKPIRKRPAAPSGTTDAPTSPDIKTFK